MHRSFTVATVDEGVGIYLKEPNQDQTYVYIIPGDMTEHTGPATWVHYLFTVNTLDNTVSCRANLGEPFVMKVDAPIADYFDLSRLTLGYEQSGENVYKMVDDLLILEGEPDIAALKKYYSI